MTDATWVWRHDGTLQCGLGKEETLDDAREQLAAIIGDGSILSAEKRRLPSPMISLCGAPTGQVNAFELSEHGYWLLFHGFVGPIGFGPWVGAPQKQLEGGEVSFPFKAMAGLARSEAQVRVVGAGGGGDPRIPGTQYLGDPRIPRDYGDSALN